MQSAAVRRPRNSIGIIIALLGSIRLVDVMISILIVELLAGGIIVATQIIEARRIHSQIVQLDKLDAAIDLFYDKYDGIPGDLLSAQADRMGLPTGNGTPAHSDGDGKIQPCSPGWKNGLGCEAGLFWSQLASADLIDGRFTANVRFADSRIEETDLIPYYLPQSAIAENLFLTVWYSDPAPFSSRNYLPAGNYIELISISGIEESKIIEDPMAISPLISSEIDKKIDDGFPLRGNIIVNDTLQSEAGWSGFAQSDPLGCVTPDDRYNTREYMKAHRALCHLAIALPDPVARE